MRNLKSPSDGLPITTTVFRVRRHLRDSLNKSPWMRRMDVKPVPTEGRGSRLRGNDGLQAAGMTGFRRVVQRFSRANGPGDAETPGAAKASIDGLAVGGDINGGKVSSRRARSVPRPKSYAAGSDLPWRRTLGNLKNVHLRHIRCASILSGRFSPQVTGENDMLTIWRPYGVGQ